MTSKNNKIKTTEKQSPVSKNLVEEESAHVPPENMNNLKHSPWLPHKHLNAVIKNVKKMKFSNWLTIQLRKKFQGRLSRVFYTG